MRKLVCDTSNATSCQALKFKYLCRYLRLSCEFSNCHFSISVPPAPPEPEKPASPLPPMPLPPPPVPLIPEPLPPRPTKYLIMDGVLVSEQGMQHIKTLNSRMREVRGLQSDSDTEKKLIQTQRQKICCDHFKTLEECSQLDWVDFWMF